MSQRTDGLTLSAVVDRFTESEVILDGLQTNLRKIILAEEGAARSSEALDTASTQLTEITAALASVMAEISVAQASVSEAARAAALFMESTDLRRMDERLANLESKIDGIGQAVAAQGRDVVAAVGQVRDGLGNEIRQVSSGIQRNAQHITAVQAQADDASRRSTQALQDLEQVKSALPGRLQKRL